MDPTHLLSRGGFHPPQLFWSYFFHSLVKLGLVPQPTAPELRLVAPEKSEDYWSLSPEGNGGGPPTPPSPNFLHFLFLSDFSFACFPSFLKFFSSGSMKFKSGRSWAFPALILRQYGWILTPNNLIFRFLVTLNMYKTPMYKGRPPLVHL